MRAIMGLVENTGTVRFRDPPLPRRAPERCAARGVVLVPEGRGIFGPMTVAGESRARRLSPARHGGAGASSRAGVRAISAAQGASGQAAGSFSGGEQQMLAVGRALMADPKILLLDEPSLGLAPRVVDEISPCSAPSTNRVCRSCWWSRKRRWRCGSRSAPIFFRSAA